jgi:pantoate--beta-alanine ligase
MQVFTEIKPLRAYFANLREPGFSVGLVPTMGALHAGHLSLVAHARAENRCTVATIFVNPIQFNNPDDLAKYPRTLERDLAQLAAAGCDAVFAPKPEEVYPIEPQLRLHFGELETKLEGAFRPGHFNGVGLVVARLLHIIEPTRAYFGRKDYQQLQVIRQLVRDLAFNTEIVACATVREPDGLAMSSRNQRLSAQERLQAPVLYQALQFCRDSLRAGGAWTIIRSEAAEKIKNAGARLEYLELADAENLQPTDGVDTNNPTVLLVAAYVGAVRLIDNLLV